MNDDYPTSQLENHEQSLWDFALDRKIATTQDEASFSTVLLVFSALAPCGMVLILGMEIAVRNLGGVIILGVGSLVFITGTVLIYRLVIGSKEYLARLVEARSRNELKNPTRVESPDNQ